MGLIKKKTASRGTEGGVKYVCDVCSADITSTVSSECTSPTCINASERPVHPHGHCVDICRSVYVVPAVSVMSMTSACHASPTPSFHATMTLGLIHIQ